MYMKKTDVSALIQKWLEAGAITPEQSAYMNADLTEYTSKESGDKFITSIMYIGGGALSLGALLFIASNWAYLSKSVKLVLALLLPTLPLVYAYWQLSIKNNPNILGRVANIFGLTLVGGSLALVGQIYNLESDWVFFFWMWAILTAPFVLIFKTAENVAFSSILIGVALLFSIFKFLEGAHTDISSIIILVTSASLLYAVILYGIGSALRYVAAWALSSRVLRIGGGSLAATVLFITTFDFYAQAVIGYENNASGWEMLAIVFNLGFVAFLVFVLMRALRYEEYNFAFSIVRLFGLYLFVKYCTLFYSMFDTAIFFLVGGVLFILGGWFLEKNKKHLTGYMKRGDTGTLIS